VAWPLVFCSVLIGHLLLLSPVVFREIDPTFLAPFYHLAVLIDKKEEDWKTWFLSKRTDHPNLRIVRRGVLPQGCFSGKEHAHRIEIDRALDFRASRGLFFTYLVLGGIIHHALSHSEGVAQRSELCLQLNTVVFMRVIVLMRALMKCDPTLP
jgi:hypothetical protein